MPAPTEVLQQSSQVICERTVHAGWHAAFTQRHGGVSGGNFSALNLGLHVGDSPRAVRENRGRFFASCCITDDKPIFAQQIHSGAVARVGISDAGRGVLSHADALPGIDALVTTARKLPLVCLSADCLLLALCDSTARVLGVLHAGWRGMAAGVIDNTLAGMHRAGADVSRIRVYGAPSIGPCCFEVGCDVVAALGGTYSRPASDGKWMYDLRAAAAARLTVAGIPAEQLEISSACTCCESEKYFSHRRSTREGQKACGRMALMAWLD
jgi:polyphenol oxidase